MLTGEADLTATGLDAVALKPAECDLERALDLPLPAAVIDYEGREHFPAPETLERLADETALRVTTPVRADGFDPLGDDELAREIPASVDRALVAGHGAYLTEAEAERAVVPRLRAARERHPEAWVGTEGVERIAMALGGTQYDLLSRTTRSDLRRLREAGFEGRIAVYAPTVLTDDTDAVLDAVGDYVARRRSVARTLPDGAATDASAAGTARDVLAAAARDYALIGTPTTIGERVAELKEAGADAVVGYPARGVEEFLR